jgi:hypothetical protein
MAPVSELCGDRFDSILVPIRQYNRGAGVGKCFGRRQSKPGRRARDKCHFVFERNVHFKTPMFDQQI